jgi:hypothetical protein
VAAAYGVQVEPVRMLEVGSGISDVTSMVWTLMMQRLRAGEHLSASRLTPACVRGPRTEEVDDASLLKLFHITNVEYSDVTGRTAEALLAKAGRSNVSVRYGSEIGDATVLKDIEVGPCVLLSIAGPKK